MKRRHVFLRFLLCVLFPALGSVQAWANNDYYYAQVTATAIPTGAGTVYAQTSGDNATQGTQGTTTSTARGSTTTSGDNVGFTFTATPSSSDYDFKGWSTTNDVDATPTSTANPYSTNYKASTTKDGTQSHNIYAIFAVKPTFYFSASAVATPAGGGTAEVSPATTSVRGERWNDPSATATATFTATPNDGYAFDGWYSAASGGTLISRSNPYNATITSTSKDSDSPTNTTYYARFLSIANPTGITATDQEINLGNEWLVDNYTITSAAGTIPFEYVSAVSENTSIATVTNNDDGTVTITGVAEGVVNITLIAHNTDKSRSPYTATFALTVSDVPGTGVNGTKVILNDFEDHKWSYYSDPDCPIRSLNPADVQITYYGNGTNTVSTSNNATPGNTFTASTDNSVAVGIDAPEHTFIYYKTLERTDGATATTVAGATGRCAYTTIPNPFSKRPTYGTGDTRYRGFYAWRVKSVEGGAIYTAATGGTAINVNGTINAETEVYFAPTSSTGMKVELEALWARAYVATSNTTTGLSNAVSYERNFVYLSSNQTLRNAALDYPVTYTTVDPATGAGTKRTITIRDGFTCDADTKFENLTFAQYNNNAQTISADGKNLIIGRGCEGTINYIAGFAGTNITNPNYTLRIESGTINYVSFMRGYSYGDNNDDTSDNGGTVGGTPEIKAVLGCDYDRATNSGITNNLIVQYGVFYGYSVRENGLTYSDKALKAYVKSGKIGNNITIANGHAAGAHQVVYIGVAGQRVRGHRQLYVEGGELASIAGGIDATQNANNNSVTIRMTGGHVRGAVYGGAARSAAYGHRHLIVTGGSITGWIGGGCNGEAYPAGQTSEDTYGGITNGAARVYFGGDATCGGTGSNVNINGSQGGIVFGAGKGVEGNTTSGRMAQGTTVVVADECDIERNVYGGGNFGYAQTSTDVFVSGGTVHGRVFGGSNQNNGPVIDITMKGGTIEGGLYGGSNTTGTINNSITMNINGGQVGTDATHANIHGGGYGAPTRVTGNVDITLGTTTQTTPGVTVYGDIYGGSALGNVNTNTSNHTNLTLNKGVVYGDAYGGGLGDDSNAALVNGNVTVTENGVAFVKGTTTDDAGNEVENAGRIFGCNNLNGSPQGTVLVHVLKTGRADGGEHTKSVYDSEGNITTYNYEVGAVYGGGNLAPYAPADPTATGQYTGKSHVATSKPVQVVIDGCDEVSIEYVYGGGNAAPVPSTDLVIYGSYELGSVFGGGNGKDKYTRNNGATWNVNPGADVGINGGNYGTGNANTEVYGGFIHELYGASNQKGRIVGSINQIVKVDDSQSDCPLNVLKIVGAGKNADIDQDVNMVMGCMPTAKTELVFAGADNANVNGHVELTITSGTFGKVFGGNNLGGIIKGYIKVNVEETGCTPINIDELYLGGNQAAYSIYGYYADGTLPDGRTRYLPRTSASDPHTAVDAATFPVPYAQPVLNVISCTSIGKVFGGGLGAGAAMYANPTVNINMIKGAFADNITATADNPNQLGSVENVYGGGNEAAVYGNTTVNIGTETSVATVTEHTHLTPDGSGKYAVEGAYITGTVYGAGKGVESNPEAAIVTGNAYVTMRSGHVSRSIYGGGELGSVGTFTATYGNGESDIHIEGEPKTCAANTGLTKVLISGGQVGVNHALMPDPADETSNDDFGYVFCACKGLNSGDAVANKLAVSGSSYLEISGTALITASIYGGSENGQMLGNAHVKITGGQIGTGHYKVGNTNYWDGIYTEEQWNTAINKIKAGTFTDADAAPFHQCDAWPFKAEGSRYIYDHDAIYESNGEYYYDAEHTQSSHGGSNKAGSGHSFFGNVFGGGSGYYPYAPGQWRRSAGRVCGNTYVEITGGHILTNVYGGNEITDVIGHCKIEMSGGTVGLPRSLNSIQARPVNSYIFGGGMGDPRIMFNEWSNVGSAEVIVRNNAVVFGSVFGGGEDGHILGDVTTTIQDNVVIGTFGSSGVDGNIFGSGRGFSTLALTAGTVCGNVTVNIKDNVKILGSIYGGGEFGAVLNSVKVNINGGNISGDVYGGGALANTNTTGGATIVNLLGGTILGDAYGGGLGRVAKAAVGTEGNPGYVPAVTAVPAYVNGNVTVTLDGTTFNPTTTTDDASHAVPNSGRVFGCNNLNGTPKGTVLVHVKRTRPYSGARAKGSYEVQAVYGGGNLATYDPTDPEADGQYSENGHDATKKPLQVVIDACDEASIEYVYGGGNAAAAPATDVLILGSYDINKVFAGGNGEDKYTLDGGTTWIVNEGADVGWKDGTHNTTAGSADYGKVTSGTVYGTGMSRVIAMGGRINMLFGGSNTTGDVRTSADVVLGDQNLQTCVLEIGEIYGGGNEAYMSASTSLDLKCVEGFNEIYGGARNANVAGDISMTITGGRYNKVFGGNNVGGVISGTITVNVDERGCLPIEIGELYGGGNQAAYSVENIPAARRTSLATASGNANAYKNYPQVNVISATSIGKVFGGGLGNTAVVTGNPHVNINMQKGSVNGDYVYVDGKSPAEYASYASGYEESAGVPRVFPYKLALGTIGIVFGGGNAANVVGDTYVNIGDGTFINENGEASTVTRRSAQITGRVFGGGNNAEVSGNTHVVIGKKE